MPDRVQQAIGLAVSILSAPVIVLLMILIRAGSAGPPIYRAVRVGAGGRPFVCYKLRTMTWRPESEVIAITVRDDRRVTRLGRALRRLRLDELPQLWNVARGEMRLVGPRPESPRFVDLERPDHRVVFNAKPGITGLAQLLFTGEAELLTEHGAEATYREHILPAKIEYDLAYLRQRSTRLDLWILAQTPRAILGGKVRLPASLRSGSGAELGPPPTGSEAGRPR